MKLVTIARGNYGSSGALVGDDVLDFGLAAELVPEAIPVPGAVRDILDQSGDGLAHAQRAVAAVAALGDAERSRLRRIGALTERSSARLLAPLPTPQMIFSHGKAYHSHVRDFEKDAVQKAPDYPPAGFIKATSAVVGPGQDIRIPAFASDMIDYEGEFCVVFGRDCHGVKAADAWDYIAGFTIINDVSARDWIPRMRGAAPGDAGTISALNVMYKNLPTFCPLGPVVATKDEFAGNFDFHLTTRLNGQLVQDTWTRDLIWSIPELIEAYSAIMAFTVGDVLSTGTPGGVGAGRTPQLFMKAGDTISVAVDGIGELSNTLVNA